MPPMGRLDVNEALNAAMGPFSYWGNENSHIGAFNFYPILILYLNARFQVSVFRICYWVYLS